MTPCEKAGYQEGDLFQVIVERNDYHEDVELTKGSIVRLIRDDNTQLPFFELVKGTVHPDCDPDEVDEESLVLNINGDVKHLGKGYEEYFLVTGDNDFIERGAVLQLLENVTVNPNCLCFKIYRGEPKPGFEHLMESKEVYLSLDWVRRISKYVFKEIVAREDIDQEEEEEKDDDEEDEARTTPFQAAGYIPSDMFKLTSSDHWCLKKGALVQLKEDDGTQCPEFTIVDGENHNDENVSGGHIFIYIQDIQKMGGSFYGS